MLYKCKKIWTTNFGFGLYILVKGLAHLNCTFVKQEKIMAHIFLYFMKSCFTNTIIGSGIIIYIKIGCNHCFLMLELHTLKSFVWFATIYVRTIVLFSSNRYVFYASINIIYINIYSAFYLFDQNLL